MANRDKNAAVISIEPSIHDRLLRIKSMMSTVRMACLYKMETDQDFFDISETTQIMEELIGDIAEELETKN